MKKLLLGVLLGVILYPAMYEALEYVESHTSVDIDLPYRFEYGFTKPFNKLCTKDVSKNGHGWVFVNRKYFRCGKLAIYVSDKLYGEYTKPRNKELEKEACKECRL